MFNLDPGKLIVIAVVAIILLGPDKLPQVARQLGGAWRSFGEFRRRMESEVRSTMPDLPPTHEIARLARSPAALLHHLSTMSEKEEEEAAQAAKEWTADTAELEDGPAVAETDREPAAPTDGSTASATTTLANTDHGVHDAGSNGSGPASPAGATGPPPEPAVPADPNLN